MCLGISRTLDITELQEILGCPKISKTIAKIIGSQPSVLKDELLEHPNYSLDTL